MMNREFKIVSRLDVEPAEAEIRAAQTHADAFLNVHFIDEHAHQLHGGAPTLDKGRESVKALHGSIHNALLEQTYVRIAKMFRHG